MKRTAYLLLVVLAVAAGAQPATQANSNDALTARIQRDHELHARALEIVQAEDARAKQPLCPNAMNTREINECSSAELEITNANYLKLVRALGGLLRSGDSGDDGTPPKPISFDHAESAWDTYRELACNAAGDRWAGGTIRPSVVTGCRLTVTRHHIDELWAIYSDLGTR